MMADEQHMFRPPDEAEDQPADEGDYVFRFRLSPLDSDEGGYGDPLLELIRGQLADLLRAVVLTHRGRRVMVDGFRLLRDPDTQYELFPAVAPPNASVDV